MPDLPTSAAALPSSTLPRRRWPFGALAVTAACSALVLLLSRVGIPDVEAWGERGPFHAGAIGLSAFFVAFLVVEFFAAVVPALRPLRGSVDGRRRLIFASMTLAAALALVQAFLLMKWVETLFVRADPVVFVGVLFGGAVATAVAALVIDRYGVGHGFSVLALLTTLGSVAHDVRLALLAVRDQSATPAGFLFFALCLGSVVVVVLFGGGVDDRHPGRAPRPASGLLPMWIVVVVQQLAVLAHSSAPDIPRLPAGVDVAFDLALAAAAGFVFSRVFGGVGHDAKPGVGFAVLLVAVTHLLRRAGLPLDVVNVAVSVAILKDIVGELRARSDGPLVLVASLPRPALAGPALADLADKGIIGFVRGLHHRTLLQIFGPFVPVDVYVPAERAAAARAVLEKI